MSEFVQAFDPIEGVYRKIHVRTCAFVGQSHRPYEGLDEVEPLESEPKPRPTQDDPLEAMR